MLEDEVVGIIGSLSSLFYSLLVLVFKLIFLKVSLFGGSAYIVKLQS